MITTTMRLYSCILVVCLVLPSACVDRSAQSEQDAAEHPRLAVLSPGFAATLADLGYADQIVARHAYDIVLPKSIPVAGDQAGFDYERLVGVHPTHILLEQSAQSIPERMIEFAERYGWRVIELPAATLGDVTDSILELDNIANPASRPSVAAVQLLERFNKLRAREGTSAIATDVLLVTWIDPVGVMGPGSYHYELAEHIGLNPLPESGARYISFALEDLIRLDPPVIILVMPNHPEVEPSSLIPLAARERLSACRTGNVILLNDPAGLLPSSRLIALAIELHEGVKTPAPSQ
jgi:ABC-type Fe3+-hydroxamate transport system substrate-binding protein